MDFWNLRYSFKILQDIIMEIIISKICKYCNINSKTSCIKIIVLYQMYFDDLIWRLDLKNSISFLFIHQQFLVTACFWMTLRAITTHNDILMIIIIVFKLLTVHYQNPNAMCKYKSNISLVQHRIHVCRYQSIDDACTCVRVKCIINLMSNVNNNCVLKYYFNYYILLTYLFM